MEPAAHPVRRVEGRVHHPVRGAARQARGIVEARRVVGNGRQILVQIVDAHAAADEEAGRAHLVPAQGRARPGGEAQSAFQQVVAGEAVHAEQGQVVQFGDLAVLVGDAGVQLGLVRDRQLRHRLQNHARCRAEPAIEGVADVDPGAGAGAHMVDVVNAQGGRQVADRIDVGAQVDERLPAHAQRRDQAAPPLGLARHAAAVHPWQAVGRPGRNELRGKGGEADIGLAVQRHGRAAQPQPPAEHRPFGLPARLDQGGDQGQGVVVLEDVEGGGDRIELGHAQALQGEGRDRQIGARGLAFGVDLADQAAAVAVIEAVVLIGVAHVIAVEQGLVRDPLGGEAPAPGAVGIEPAVGQKIAAAGPVAEADVALGLAVAVQVEVAETAAVGVAAARHDGPVREAAAPLDVHQGRDLGVELRAEQPVLGGRNDAQVGHFERKPAPGLIVHRRHQEARGALDRRVGVGEGRQVEDRHPAQAEDYVAVEDRPQLFVLNRLLGLDRHAGRPGTVGVADGAGGEDDVVQFADRLGPAHRRGGHQTGPVRQAGGQVDRDPGLEVAVQLDAAGVDDRAVRRRQLGVARGRGDALLKVIGQVLGAQAVVLEPGQDAVLGRAVGRDHVAVALGGIGVDEDGVGRQAVGAARRRRLGRRRGRRGRVLCRGRVRQSQLRQGRAYDQRRAGQQPKAQGSHAGEAAVAHAVSTHCRPGEPSD
ncbi:hypothetical protein D3C77_282060 [compost metagenome]